MKPTTLAELAEAAPWALPEEVVVAVFRARFEAAVAKAVEEQTRELRAENVRLRDSINGTYSEKLRDLLDRST